MRPYHAGLLGADVLVVLDEAHLVPPFEALLRRVADDTNEFGPNGAADRKIVPQVKLLSLSATGRSDKEANGRVEGVTFRLDDEDLSDPLIAKRLAAKKALGFVKIGDGKEELADELAQQAWRLSGDGGPPVRCLVYCDSREVAERTKKIIDGLAEGNKKQGIPKIEIDAELFVGARRVREREKAKDLLKGHGFLAGSDVPTRPAFLVATSAGEVGVDLNADHMVCDLVPWERMVQRLGRVNRRGDGDASIIVVHGDEPKPKKPEAPTDSEKRQITAFKALAVLEALPTDGDGRNTSPGALRELKLRAETDAALRDRIEQATTGEPLHPALTRPLVDAWSMTSLEEHTGRPEIEPWLRGWVEDDEPQNSVVWRKYLPVRTDRDDWPSSRRDEQEVEAFFEAAPPHTSEMLETERRRVVEWLIARAKAALREKRVKPIAEDEAARETASEAGAESAADPIKPDTVIAFALTPAGKYKKCYGTKDFAKATDKNARDRLASDLGGAVLVVDARLRGFSSGLLNNDSEERPPTADDDPWEWITVPARRHDVGEALREPVIRFRIREAARIEDIKSAASDWHKPYSFATRMSEDGEPLKWLVVEKWRDASTTEDEKSVSRKQDLTEHQAWTAEKASRLAARLSLPDDFSRALVLAARLHDEGKKSTTWQRAFSAPRERDKEGNWKIFAKTEGPFRSALLDGYRHEFGSLPWAEKDPEFRKLPEELQELVLHLIAAHHGFARPVIATRGCEDAPPSALEARARGVALRFARLQRRWGPWGLAWWEALLRAADQQASRDNDRREGLGAARTEGE
ncbi:MAG: type I-G CRISPR-associated helicase/endonuclease Cas3g [Stellaceae bacterium]